MRTCARCGADCDREFSLQTREGVTAYYCDDPASTVATCYFLSMYSGFPEFEGLT